MLGSGEQLNILPAAKSLLDYQNTRKQFYKAGFLTHLRQRTKDLCYA